MPKTDTAMPITITISEYLMKEIDAANTEWAEYLKLDSRPNSPRILKCREILLERLMWHYRYIGELLCEQLDTNEDTPYVESVTEEA